MTRWFSGVSVRLRARTATTEAECPGCGTWFRYRHSRYERSLSDTAVGGSELLIDLQVHRFVCRNDSCGKKTFAEQVPSLTVRYGRRSVAAGEALRAIALALAERLVTAVSRMTLLRLIRSLPVPFGDGSWNGLVGVPVVMGMRSVDVLVIGAGQAGLSAAYHLQRRGFVPVARASGGDRTFVVLDAEDGPGGAWQHRWASLKMATINGIYELPGFPVPPADPDASSRDVLPAYFADYEQRFNLEVQRPVRVRAVRRPTMEDGTETDGPLIVETDSGSWSAGHVINATGTWTRPHWPYYPGMETFRGRQLHVHDYVSAEEFAGKRVVIVGAGISATQLLEEISRVADTFWVTRTEPVWEDRFSTPKIRAALARAEERVREGLPPQSIVRVTGMHRTPWTERAEARGVLVRHPMFTRIEEHGVRMPDGSFEPADVILWATGFRAELRHLAPLRLRTPQGGIRVANGRSVDEPQLFVIGYGPSQSTIGANRAGRDAVIAILSEPAAVEAAAIPA